MGDFWSTARLALRNKGGAAIRESGEQHLTTLWREVDQELLGELDALEADMAAEAEAGDVPSYLQDTEEIPSLPSVPADGEANAVPPPPQGYPAIQTDEYGLPVANTPQRAV
ncbi:hypothetical protein CYMTET_14449 [Cymbomonas tetramitiformis]|uniref:Uncharacterized protein n=1 Tax=Cymbomonas tetramitiformis TaxID=36881 RepID=A0AAE0GFY8_9CHLO|nr:hypothetical protein CYMTET_14449 [Cymbomonas tetramitiformis]